MEGIHILNTTAVTEIVDWYIPIIILCGSLAGICFLIASETYRDGLQIFFGILALIFLLALIIIGAAEPKVKTDRKRYEVTIDESASLIDVYKKYDVIEQRGQIWILEDKEINE